jgi:hypothetical protein
MRHEKAIFSININQINNLGMDVDSSRKPSPLVLQTLTYWRHGVLQTITFGPADHHLSSRRAPIHAGLRLLNVLNYVVI